MAVYPRRFYANTFFYQKQLTVPDSVQTEKLPPARCLRAGITGGMGSGKTTVCHIFETLGVPVYYADVWAKTLLQRDPELRENVSALFGAEAYLPDGTYNRPYVAKIVFSDPAKLAALNALVHPAVDRHSRSWHEYWAEAGQAYTLREAALLVENGSFRKLDALIVVTAPEALRIERVLQRDGLSLSEVQARLKNQLPEAEKVKQAHFVVNNDGQHLLIPQVLDIHKRLLEQARR